MKTTSEEESRKDQENLALLEEKILEAAHEARDLGLDKDDFLEQAEEYYEWVLETERDFVVEDNLDALCRMLVRAADFARRKLGLEEVRLFMEEAGAAFAYSKKHPLA